MTSGAAGPRRSPRWPSAASPVVGVIGDPVRHSLSPLLHNAAFDAMGLDWVSVAFPVPAWRLAEALAGMGALGIVGLSVTMPHKEQAEALVDDRTPLARRLRSVNCVTLGAQGRLVGDSTDGQGLLQALRRGADFDAAARRCVVIGAGGAARAVVAALADAGAAEVVVVNRRAGPAEEAASLAGAAGRVGTVADVPRADLVVQATPVGMGDTRGPAGAFPFDPELLRPGQVVTDLVYRPATTPLLEAATTRGARPVAGTGMLVHQAALALERWTRATVPVEAMWAAAGENSAPTDG